MAFLSKSVRYALKHNCNLPQTFWLSAQVSSYKNRRSIIQYRSQHSGKSLLNVGLVQVNNSYNTIQFQFNHISQILIILLKMEEAVGRIKFESAVHLDFGETHQLQCHNY